MNRPFSPSEISIIEREWPAGTETAVIAQMIGREPHAVQQAASRRKIRRSRNYLKTLRGLVGSRTYLG